MRRGGRCWSGGSTPCPDWRPGRHLRRGRGEPPPGSLDRVYGDDGTPFDPPDPDPRGLRLAGARIGGPLDLEHLETSVVVDLHSCEFDDEIMVRDARIPSLVLVDCVLRNATGTALNAQRLVARRRLHRL